MLSKKPIDLGGNFVTQRLQVAIWHYKTGEIFEAESACRNILKHYSNHPETLYLLGLIAYDKKEYDVALSNINQACGINKSNPYYQNLLGSIFCEQNIIDKAVNCHIKAITLKPDFAEAYYNLGNDYLKQENFQDAITCYEKSISIKPNYQKSYYSLGIVYNKQSFYEIAENCFKNAIQINSTHAEAYANLGVTLNELGRLDESESSYRQAILLKPDCAEAYANLGATLNELGRLNESESSYRQAILLKPDCAEAYANLGVTLNALGRLDESESSYRQAISLKPDYVMAHGNLLFCLYYMSNSSPVKYFKDVKKYGALCAHNCYRKYTNWQSKLFPTKLKIGFISGDLRTHPVGFFLEGLLKGIESSRLELFAYSSTRQEDDLTDRIRPFFKEWRSISSYKDEKTAMLIHDDALHILIDLSGHTGKNRLPVFAYKPAPIQVTWLGYFATTGVAEIDYLLGDPHVTPVNEEHHFTERIWRLPETYLCFSPPREHIDVGGLPARTNEYITFGCFNNLAKMNNSVVALWAKVLNAVPNSKLFLKTKLLNDKLIVEKTLNRFAAHGISIDRLTLEGPSPRPELLASYNRVDIALDPSPYPGGTTTVEALWMGVPVLTKCGDRFLSHVSESIAHNANQSEWIANDDEDYVRKAVKFSSDFDLLAKLRTGLRAQVLASPLFDAPRFALHFEEAMWGMWNELTSKREGIQ